MRFLKFFILILILFTNIFCQNSKKIDLKKFFSLSHSPFNNNNFSNKFSNKEIFTDISSLYNATRDSLRYFKEKELFAYHFVKPRDFTVQILSWQRTMQTLEFILQTIEEDKKNNSKFRILDPNFINKNFKFIKWSGDIETAFQNKIVIPEYADGKIPKNQIRLTNYAIFKTTGSYLKTKKYSCALYQIIAQEFAEKDRFKFTKQQIIDGALNTINYKNKIKPIVWLDRDGLEDAIMQGSIVVEMPDGKNRIFNVDKSNGMDFDKIIKDLKAQKRYWYFKELEQNTIENNITHLNHGQAIFAGDINNIGIGKLISVVYINPVTKQKEARLGVLCDTGGAFKDNLYQLDYFMGIFDDKKHFYSQIRHLPNTVEAYILAKK
ncbi:hypothetical protein K9M16_01220 [Candidatus Babeliales bacterium]|nr:hypothetical protein [Candidatus Babeliales bacterium]